MELKEEVNPYYPSVRYHPTRGTVVVTDERHERRVANANDGWVKNPADFPESPVKEPTISDKLDLLETLGAMIASEAVPEESLQDTLLRIMNERNAYAQVIAKLKLGERDAKPAKAKE